jgi:oligoribonuclease
MNILWLDTETSGLDPDRCALLEVAAVLDVDGKLTPVFDGVLKHDVEKVYFEQRAYEMHCRNGLMEDLANGWHSLEVREAESDLMDALEPFRRNSVILGGNSIHFDRGFLRRHMPRLEAMLHYRMMDVTTLHMFFGAAGIKLDKPAIAHRAMADIRQSIDAYYKFQALLMRTK